MYMTGGVDEGNVKQGKATMTAALAGFALALAAPPFLKEIPGILAALIIIRQVTKFFS